MPDDDIAGRGTGVKAFEDFTEVVTAGWGLDSRPVVFVIEEWVRLLEGLTSRLLGSIIGPALRGESGSCSTCQC